MPKGVYIRTKPNHWLGKKHSPQSLIKISIASKNRIVSEETRQKISLFQKGRVHSLGFKHTTISKEKMSKAHKNKHLSLQTRIKIGISKSGDKCPFWKGGVSKENKLIRASLKYKQWRKSVFERDKYTCVFCGKIGGELNADHIKPFCSFVELRLEVSNGRTLCVPCHKSTPTYARNLTKETNVAI